MAFPATLCGGWVGGWGNAAAALLVPGVPRQRCLCQGPGTRVAATPTWVAGAAWGVGWGGVAVGRGAEEVWAAGCSRQNGCGGTAAAQVGGVPEGGGGLADAPPVQAGKDGSAAHRQALVMPTLRFRAPTSREQEQQSVTQRGGGGGGGSTGHTPGRKRRLGRRAARGEWVGLGAGVGGWGENMDKQGRTCRWCGRKASSRGGSSTGRGSGIRRADVATLHRKPTAGMVVLLPPPVWSGGWVGQNPKP